jgi:hypothetical protein
VYDTAIDVVNRFRMAQITAVIGDSTSYMVNAIDRISEEFNCVGILCLCHLIHLPAVALTSKPPKKNPVPLGYWGDIQKLATTARDYTLLREVQSVNLLPAIPSWGETRYILSDHRPSINPHTQVVDYFTCSRECVQVFEFVDPDRPYRCARKSQSQETG